MCKTTVCGIPSCKTLLHVFREFIGKFHVWNVSLCNKNSTNCDEAAGLAQKWPDLTQNTNYMTTNIYYGKLTGKITTI